MTEGIWCKFQSALKFAAFESPQSASLTAPLVPKGSLGAYEFAEDSRKIGISCGRTESSAPTTRRGRKRLVGADDSVGPKNVANSPGITVKTVRSAGAMWASAPTNARFGGSPKFAAFESPQSASLTAPLVPKGSLGAYEFAEDSRKFGISCGRTESSAPTTRRGAKTTCRGRRLCRPERRGLSNIKTSPHDRGEVSRGTTLIMLAHISALLYREAPAALSRGRSKLAADRLAEGLSPSPSL